MRLCSIALVITLLMSCTFAKDLEQSDARFITEALEAGSWKIYVIYFYWKGEKENDALTQGLQTEVVDKYGDLVNYGEVDCSGNDFHSVLDLFEFQNPLDNFVGRSIHLEELPMVLAIVHGVGYVSHGETSYKLIASVMPELIDYASRKSIQKAY